MASTIEFAPAALNQLKALGTEPARRIVRTLESRVARLDDPRSLGSALAGEWTGFWRYRIGDYRIIAKITDERLLISVVRVAHRREVYRR